MLSVPVPSSPMYTAPSSCRLPAPDMDKVPVSPAPTPISTNPAAAPADMICDVPPLLICAVALESGTPADQFPGVNQSPVPSVHTVVWEKADAEAASSEIKQPWLLACNVISVQEISVASDELDSATPLFGCSGTRSTRR